jgi:aldose 1-epimerase
VIPSGRQVVLEHGDARAVVVEVGGGLRSYAVGGRELLDGYAEDERCTSARGQVLAPWPNRLRGGRYGFGGVDHQVALTEPETGGAIHGFVRWVRWTATEETGDAVTMRYALPPQSGWPFALDLAVRYALGPDGLRVETSATNAGDGPAPAGLGMHPYLRAGGGPIDAARLRAPGRVRLVADDAGIPTGATAPVAGSDADFLVARPIGSVELDTGFGDLARDPDGRARIELAPEDGEPTGLWLDEGFAFLMLFTGDGLPDPERRRRGLGVEPMTCAPDALASGDGLAVLAPGETLSAAWGIERPAPSAG